MSQQSQYKNAILIDNNVREYHNLSAAVGYETLVIVYSYETPKSDILAKLQTNFPNNNIERIAICSHECEKRFLQNETFFDASVVQVPNPNFNNGVQEEGEEQIVEPEFINQDNGFLSNDNTQFIIQLVDQYNVQKLDYLACSSLNYEEWKDYYNFIETNTSSNVVIGASDDKTGNIKHGGDWLLENTNENIKSIYFDESIEYYKYLFSTTLYATGYNGFYNLGLGNNTNQNKFTPITINIPTTKKIKMVAGGYYDFVIILLDDGTMMGCGRNDDGQLGLGNNTTQSTFQPIPLSEKVNYVSCGDQHTLIILDNGKVMSVGRNTSGQLGLNYNNPNKHNTFQYVTHNMPNSRPIQVVAARHNSFILFENGKVYSCGHNNLGQLGHNDTTTKYKFTQITQIYAGNWNTNYKAIHISSGWEHTGLLDDQGQVYTCGYNNRGQLGHKNNTQYIYFKKIDYYYDGLISTTGVKFKQISCGYDYTFILRDDGKLFSCGYNQYGQLGHNNNSIYNYPKYVDQGSIDNENITQIFCFFDRTSFALQDNGKIWNCGYNNYGQLGHNNTTNLNSFTTVTQNSIHTKNIVHITGSKYSTYILEGPSASNLISQEKYYNFKRENLFTFKFETPYKNTDTISYVIDPSYIATIDDVYSPDFGLTYYGNVTYDNLDNRLNNKITITTAANSSDIPFDLVDIDLLYWEKTSDVSINDSYNSKMVMSKNGSTLALGNKDANNNTGHVKIYKKDNNGQWQVVSMLTGDAENDNFGDNISINNEGTIIAISAQQIIDNEKHGYVRIYQVNATNNFLWNQIGATLQGDNTKDTFGKGLSISNDGTIVAIGSPQERKIDSGYVKVFQWSGTSWDQMGTNITGTEDYELFGSYVSLSGNGKTLGIGTLGTNNRIKLNFSHVEMWSYIGTSWTQINADIVLPNEHA
jgi:alpha-tubulin suppressor-like RCC1 family protein